MECGGSPTVDVTVRVENTDSSVLLCVLAMLDVIFPQTMQNVIDKKLGCI